MALDPAAALSERLGMSEKLFDLSVASLAHEAMLNRQHKLRDDLEVAVHEHIQRVRDHSLGRVLDRDNSVIRPVFAYFAEDIGDGFLRCVTKTRTKTPDGRLMREGSLRAEISHGQ